MKGQEEAFEIREVEQVEQFDNRIIGRSGVVLHEFIYKIQPPATAR